MHRNIFERSLVDRSITCFLEKKLQCASRRSRLSLCSCKQQARVIRVRGSLLNWQLPTTSHQLLPDRWMSFSSTNQWQLPSRKNAMCSKLLCNIPLPALMACRSLASTRHPTAPSTALSSNGLSQLLVANLIDLRRCILATSKSGVLQQPSPRLLASSSGTKKI